MKVEGFSKGYLATISVALKTYLEFIKSVEFDPNHSNESFVFVYGSHMHNAPFLSEHAGAAFSLAQFMVTAEPLLKAVQLAGMTAAIKTSSMEVFRTEGLLALKKELLERGTPLPAIVDP